MIRSYRALVFVFLCQAAPLAAAQTNGGGDEYVFDTRLFRGNGISQSLLDRFNRRQSVPPGAYVLEVFLNQNFIERLNVELKEDTDGDLIPCLTPEQIQRIGILLPDAGANRKTQPQAEAAQVAQITTQTVQTTTSDGITKVCLDIAQSVPGAIVQLRMDVFRLNLQVPQAQTRRMPRGYVNPTDLDAGATVGFVNYMGNYYHTWQQTGNNTGSGYLSLRSGLNMGLWQLRHVSNANWTQGAGIRWRNTSTYVQRPLLSIGSQLTLGQTFTQGRFFSGLNYIGLSLNQDDRMLPDTQRGYAPVVRGVANSNARVSIHQDGREIYQTTVPPGAFEIADLYPNSYSGDLEVQVQETDGTLQSFTVPYAAVPESLREGQSRYELSLGRTHDAGKDSVFGDVVYQRGVSNAATLHGGLRLAQGYRSLMVGGVYAGRFGALGSDVTWSRAQLLGGETSSGWMARLSYSNTITTTGTTVTLANYRYSTTGYQDLANVLALRQNGAVQSSTWRQRNRFDVRLNQSLRRFGTMFVSASMQDYHDGRPRNTQYQLGYGTVFSNGFSANVVLMRQHVSSLGTDPGRRETTVMLSLSIPLGPNLPALSSTFTSGSGSSTQTSFGDSLDEAGSLYYNLGAGYDRSARQTTLNASLSKRFSAVATNISASHNRNTQQLSANVMGALAVHAGGVTFGHYVSDTFALIQAPGATGAKVFNGQTEIDGNGYALVSSMTPYRYNSVTLDPGGMTASAELLDGEQRSAPYAGAVVKLTFQTRRGHALLIRTAKSDGLPIPFGAEVFDASGTPIGMVGQGGRIYVRAEDSAGQLTVRWGPEASEQCVVPYQIDVMQLQDQPLVRLEGVCGG